jgi:transposase InsO family protein
MVKLTDKKIRWIVKQVVNEGRDTEVIAKTQKISRRRVQQLAKFYKETGKYPVLNMGRRPKTFLSKEQKQIIDKAFNESFLGASLLRHYIKQQYGMTIPKNKIHQYMVKKKYSQPNPNKQKKRKRCRYERTHSLSLVHADWCEYNEIKMIAYLDDASRMILSIGEYEHATGENTIETLKRAEQEAAYYHTSIREINTDRGSQFYANAGEKKKKGQSQFETYLNQQGIRHIPSKRNNPQTNGKIERWIQEYKKHRHRFNTAEEFKNWYNNRLHGALRLDWGETPKEAFLRKMRPETLLGLFQDLIEQE